MLRASPRDLLHELPESLPGVGEQLNVANLIGPLRIRFHRLSFSMISPPISLEEITEVPLGAPQAAVPRYFAAPEIKIERARMVLAELSQAIDSFLRETPPEVKVEIENPKSDSPKVFFHMNMTPIPEIFGAMVGDVIHNLRSALDIAACELARGRGESDQGVYFPFCDQSEALEKSIKDKRFDRAGPEAVALLREFKPYRAGNTALRAIHDLDIQDKHKMLIPTFITFATPILSRWDDDGTPNLTVVGHPTAAQDIHLLFPDDGPLAGTELLPTLHELVELVAGIVEAFRSLPRY